MKKLFIFLFIFALILIIFFGILYWNIFVEPDYKEKYYGGDEVLRNPVSGLSLEEAIEQFNEDDIYYLSVSFEIFNLHSLPFSSDTPKINLQVDEEYYNIEVIDGDIYVNSGEIADADVKIISTKEEAVKMMQDLNYVSISFNEGFTSIELIAGRIELASKGYIALYERFTQ